MPKRTGRYTSARRLTEAKAEAIHSFDAQSDAGSSASAWAIIMAALSALRFRSSQSEEQDLETDQQTCQWILDQLEHYHLVYGCPPSKVESLQRIHEQFDHLDTLLGEHPVDRRVIAVELPGFDPDLVSALDYGMLRQGIDRTFRDAVTNKRIPLTVFRGAIAEARMLTRKSKPFAKIHLLELVGDLGGIYQQVTGKAPTLGSRNGQDARLSRFEAFALPIVKIVRKETEIASLRATIRLAGHIWWRRHTAR